MPGLMKRLGDDLGAYEMALPPDFNRKKFKMEAERGEGAFWLVLVEETGDMQRYRGVLMHKEEPKDWERVILDIDRHLGVAFTPGPLDKVIRVAAALKVNEIFKDGERIWPAR